MAVESETVSKVSPVQIPVSGVLAPLEPPLEPATFDFTVSSNDKRRFVASIGQLNTAGPEIENAAHHGDEHLRLIIFAKESIDHIEDRLDPMCIARHGRDLECAARHCHE